MDWFDKIKRYFDAGFWTKEQVAQAVTLNKITPEQFQKITDTPYNS